MSPGERGMASVARGDRVPGVYGADVTTEPVGLEAPATVPIDYPGTFRPVPEFTIDIPSDWLVGEFPGALFAIATPAREDGGYANVAVRHQRVSREVTVADVARAEWARVVAEAPDAQILTEALAPMQVKQFVVESTIPGSEGVPDTHRIDSYVDAQVFGVATTDMFHIMMTSRVADADEFDPIFAAMLASLRFG